MPEETRTTGKTPVIVYGFGIAAAMWAAGYVCRLPLVMAPSQVLAALLVMCVLGGGYLAGRGTGSVKTGALAGLLSSVLNLLILGSLVASPDPDKANELLPTAALWIPGFLAAGAALAGFGAFLGARGHTAATEPPPWTNWFALITASATLLLVIAGGLVTGEEAGMDVPDWPTSFGSNMFLFPLSRMTGGIYYEHAHRLFGTLVGLASIVFAVLVWKSDRRGWVRGLSIGAFAAVSIQGILGGLRVTESNIGLAIVHGVLGQLIFALFVALAAVTSATWRGTTEPLPSKKAGFDQKIAIWLLVLGTAQVLLGALVRHIDAMLHVHITVAVIVLLAAVVTGIRAWGIYPEIAQIRKSGVFLVVIALLQLVLGFAALIAAGATRGMEDRPAVDVLVTTAHQAVGALILMTAALLIVWTRRLLKPTA